MEIHAKQVRPDSKNRADRARMLISCPDGPGIVAAVSHFLHQHGANIVQSDQYTMDPAGGMFFMRIEFDLPQLLVNLPKLEADFAEVASRFQMEWTLSAVSRKKNWLSLYPKKIIVWLNCCGNGRQATWMPILRLWSATIWT